MASKGLTEQNTQGEDKGETDTPLTVKIGDREIEVRSPGSGSLAMFTAAMSSKSGAQQIGRTLDFIMSRIADEDDRNWLEEAMLEDEVSLEEVMEALEEMMEAWSEDPTIASSGSSESSTTTGKPSTRATRKAT